MHDATPHLVTVRLPDGRLLIAHLDPAVPEHHSPLQQALRAHRIDHDAQPANTTITNA